MRKLIASLSLVLITGINAETSDNLVQDPYVEFLDSTYDYPNIHNHGTWSQDPYIYTGSSDYEHTATSDYSINLDTLKFEITKVNYGYSYKAYYDGLGAIGLAIIDANGDIIDSTTYEFDITASNNLTTVDRIYNETAYLKEADAIRLGVGGLSDRNGTDDIMITDIYLTYDYQEIPLDLVTDNSLKLALNDNTYNFPAQDLSMPEQIKVDEVKVEEPKIESTPTEAPKSTEEPKSTEVSKEEVKEINNVDKVEPKLTKEDSSTKTTKSKEVTKNESKTKTRTKQRTTGVAEALETTSMVSIASNSVNTNDPGSFFGNTGMDFESYTGIELVELVELTEPSFYEEPDFYDTEIKLTDNIQLNNIDFYKGTNWYGSNTQFY